MKYGKIISVALIVFLGLSTTSANAQVVDFRIETNKNSWFYSDLGSSTNDTNKFSGVKWITTDSKTGHRMWFRIFNSKGIAKGQLLYNAPKTDVFATNLDVNENAYLQGRRENSGDPITVVTGTWTA